MEPEVLLMNINDNWRISGHPLIKLPEVMEMLDTVINTREIVEIFQLPGSDRIRPALMAGIGREARTGLFDASLDEGELPGNWLEPVLIPAYRGGSRDACRLPTLVVAISLQKILNDKTLIAYQHGFRR